ncbi:hypothetical protein [Gordonia aquimaris]|uniref:Uncharacterized protein n=1 Tax=Gordonia aquimaris TaxID=2984863 RepID=A0A9X3I6E7_9ACTN|nr:hypothetical protein [Gordonia aquimaris]MCX2966221.1 hypothetical protein [Gordonia aquimaris]
MQLPAPHSVLTPRHLADLLRADNRRRGRITSRGRRNATERHALYQRLAAAVDAKPDDVDLADHVLRLWSRDQPWPRSRRTRTFTITPACERAH